MKIVCNYYIKNYGSVLQSFALYKKIESMGYSPQIISYCDSADKKALLEINLRIRLKYLLDYKKVKNKILKRINSKHSFNGEKRNEKFDDFIKRKMNFTRTYTTKQDIVSEIQDNEVVLIGSDQLWGPEDIIRDYHTLNWVPDTSKKISYATSFGVSCIPRYLKRRTTNFIEKIDVISVRESYGLDIIQNLTNRKIFHACDPTILFKREEWDSFLVLDDIEEMFAEKYIFCFFIGNNHSHREFCKKFKNITGLKLVSILHLDEFICSDENFYDEVFNDAGIEEFYMLIKNAEYIICDSYHAMIFSLINQKKFVVLDRYKKRNFASKNSRIDSICEKLKLTNRRAKSDDNPLKWVDAELNYGEINTLLDEWRNESLQFLKNSLEDGNDKNLK